MENNIANPSYRRFYLAVLGVLGMLSVTALPLYKLEEEFRPAFS